MGVEETGWESVDWIYVAQDWDGTTDEFLRTR